MNYKSISTKFIIGKIWRDFSPNDSNWVANVPEWVGEAMQQIGQHVGYERKVTPDCDMIQVKCHRAEYPCDFESLIGVIHNGCRLPLGADLSKYGILKNNGRRLLTASDADLRLIQQEQDRLVILKQEALTDNSQTIKTAIDEAVRNITRLAENIHVDASQSLPIGLNYYNVNPDYIITSFEDGEIQLIYDAFPIDEEGYPRIPDNGFYREAVMWFIISRLALSSKLPNPDIDFKTALILWEDYASRAANNCRYPSIDNMERFTNMWTRPAFSRQLAEQFFAAGETKTYVNTSNTATGYE